MDDRAVVESQLGRSPRAFRRVAVRCPFGCPAVTEQDPYDRAGAPFPTTYYVTCRHLVAAISRLEAAGGVERWSRAAADDPALRDSLEAANSEQRRVRHELVAGRDPVDGGASLELGIGGSGSPTGSLKCLHAHVAFALARPGYVLGERILAEVEDPWPAHECCAPAGPLSWRPVTGDVQSARLEWEEAYRRVTEAASDERQEEAFRRQLEAVTGELRKRIGGTFTLRELCDEYGRAEAWARESLAELGIAGWPRYLSIVEGAAFHLYARGAVDYAP